MDTHRLTLRPVTVNDAARIVELITPEVSRWLASWPSPYPMDAARERLLRTEASIREGRSICLAVENKTDGVMMGCVAATKLPDEPKRAELGYWLGEAYHGEGYTNEAMEAVVRAAFDTLGVDVVQGGSQPENAASVRVMQKLGMQPIGEKQVWSPTRNREELCVYFELRRQRVTK